jgi:hypothetical protein
MAQVTILSSLGTSTTVGMDPVPKSTTIQITVASGSSGSNIFAQYTLDTVSPLTWAAISSAIISSNADLLGGVTYTMLSPIAGLRLSSTTAVTGAVTLKALQSVSA